MYRCGLLDSVPEERLDVVDGIVFDTQAGERVRTEALLFLMDHTEGFEDVVGPAIQANDEEDERSVRSKGKKKTTSGDIVADAGKALAKRQRTAMQLETLTEFAEHHLEERFELSTRLATACLLIPNYGETFEIYDQLCLHNTRMSAFRGVIRLVHYHCAAAARERGAHLLLSAHVTGRHSVAHVCGQCTGRASQTTTGS